MSYVLLNNIVWEGVGEHPSFSEGARDGHFLKENDSGESYFFKGGEWVYINLGLSFIKATKSGKIVTGENGFYHVSFNTQFVNDQYSVALSTEDTNGEKITDANFYNIQNNGFDIYTRDKNGILVAGIVVSWLATRHYNP